MQRIPQNDFATTKLVAKACGVADQRKVVIGCANAKDRVRAEGRMGVKIDELVVAVDEYRQVQP